MNIRISGTPGRPQAVEGTGTVVAAMRCTSLVGVIAPDLPTPPDLPHIFVLYMNRRQWTQVESDVTQRHYEVVAEGVMRTDADTNTIAVFVQSLKARSKRAS